MQTSETRVILGEIMVAVVIKTDDGKYKVHVPARWHLIEENVYETEHDALAGAKHLVPFCCRESLRFLPFYKVGQILQGNSTKKYLVVAVTVKNLVVSPLEQDGNAEMASDDRIRVNFCPIAEVAERL